MQPACQPLPVTPGTTYRDTVRLMQPEFVYRPITGIAGAPAVVTAQAHGLAGDWPVWIRSVTGFQSINREPVQQLPHRAKRLGVDTLEINSLSAVGLVPAGGQLVYRLPVDLTGADAEMRFYVDGDLVLTLGLASGLEQTAPGTITRELEPSQTALLVGSRLTYEFDVTFSDGTVTRYFEGPIT